jgi:hypothetical protein
MTRAHAPDAQAADVVPSRPGLVTVWAAAAVALGSLLALAQAQEGPLDDPDPERQRTAFLDLGALPEPAPPVAPGVPARARPTVVLFVRLDLLDALCSSLADSDLAERAVLAIVVVGATACPAVAAVTGDPGGRLGARYGMRSPRDGGPPVGYAVVDGRGRIRYRTLDPDMADELPEVRTIVKAVE